MLKALLPNNREEFLLGSQLLMFCYATEQFQDKISL